MGEAACQAISELVARIDRKTLLQAMDNYSSSSSSSLLLSTSSPSSPPPPSVLQSLVDAVVSSLSADSWPIRDAASVTAGMLTRRHPLEMLGTDRIQHEGSIGDGGDGGGGRGGNEGGSGNGTGGGVGNEGGEGDGLDLCLDAWCAGNAPPNPNPSHFVLP